MRFLERRGGKKGREEGEREERRGGESERGREGEGEEMRGGEERRRRGRGEGGGEMTKPHLTYLMWLHNIKHTEKGKSQNASYLLL